MAQRQDSVSGIPSEDSTISGDESFVNEVEQQEELIRQLITSCSRSAETRSELPLSVNDLIRLVQLKRSTEREGPADVIEVRWIDPKRENLQ